MSKTAIEDYIRSAQNNKHPKWFRRNMLDYAIYRLPEIQKQIEELKKELKR